MASAEICCAKLEDVERTIGLIDFLRRLGSKGSDAHALFTLLVPRGVHETCYEQLSSLQMLNWVLVFEIKLKVCDDSNVGLAGLRSTSLVWGSRGLANDSLNL